MMISNYQDETGIIILNYIKYDLTLSLVNDLILKIGIKERNIIVIDNDSPNQSDKFLRTKLPYGVTYIQSGFNGGYAFGNNIGIRKGYQLGFKYLLLLNNDINFNDDFITPLIELLHNNKKISMVGPLYVGDTVELYGGKNNFYTGKTRVLNSKHDINLYEFTEFDWILGAVIAFRSDLINEIGYMNEEYFLNYEENDWQQKARRLGYKVGLVKESKVTHQGGGTISNIFGMQEYFMLRNKIIFEFNNATWYQRIPFLGHVILEMSKTILTKQNRKERIQAYYDGFLRKNKYMIGKK